MEKLINRPFPTLMNSWKVMNILLILMETTALTNIVHSECALVSFAFVGQSAALVTPAQMMLFHVSCSGSQLGDILRPPRPSALAIPADIRGGFNGAVVCA